MNIGWFIVIVGISLLQRSLVANAQAPPNDLCINAQPVIFGSSSVPIRFNTTNATSDAGCTDEYSKGIWFNFTGTGGRIVARACLIPPLFYGPIATISVFTGGCNASTRKCVATDSNGCRIEPFIFNTTVGTAYHVIVQNYASSAVDVSIFEAPPPPVNDLCVNAQPVVINASINVPITYDTTYATIDSDVEETCHESIPGRIKGIWFNFTGTGGRVVAIACAYDEAQISVFTGGCSPSTQRLVQPIMFLSKLIFMIRSTYQYLKPLLLASTICA
jgi:hypothetical protein